MENVSFSNPFQRSSLETSNSMCEAPCFMVQKGRNKKLELFPILLENSEYSIFTTMFLDFWSGAN